MEKVWILYLDTLPVCPFFVWYSWETNKNMMCIRLFDRIMGWSRGLLKTGWGINCLLFSLLCEMLRGVGIGEEDGRTLERDLIWENFIQNCFRELWKFLSMDSMTWEVNQKRQFVVTYFNSNRINLAGFANDPLKLILSFSSYRIV